MEEYLKDVSIDMIPEPYKKFAKIITPDGLLKLAELFNGSMMYIPKFDTLVRTERNNQIIKEYNNKTYKELAEKYNLDISTIAKIIINSKK